MKYVPNETEKSVVNLMKNPQEYGLTEQEVDEFYEMLLSRGFFLDEENLELIKD